MIYAVEPLKKEQLVLGRRSPIGAGLAGAGWPWWRRKGDLV
jgi:hypothetical protein